MKETEESEKREINDLYLVVQCCSVKSFEDLKLVCREA